MKKRMIELVWKVAGLHTLLAQLIAGFGFVRKETYLSSVGWYRSFQKRIPIDASGEPIPWYSYPAISFLEERVRPDWKVFEYGCGNSTLWWSKRVARVDSCEHHKGWYDSISTQLPDNAVCHFKQHNDYASFASTFEGTINVLVIDGVDRVECAKNCIPALSDAGIVIIDDSNRSEYQAGYDYLTGQGFKRLDFTGIGPITMIPVSTAIFYRVDNCLGL